MPRSSTPLVVVALVLAYTRWHTYTGEDATGHQQAPRVVGRGGTSRRQPTIAKYAKVKMDMSPYFRAMSRHASPSVMGSPQAGAPRPLSENLVHGSDDTTAGVAFFDGAKDAELPSINQNMCGSCWAIASSMALKANLALKDKGFLPTEIPNLNLLIACSDKPHQVVNTRNRDEKWLIELSSTRGVAAGCEGGITGMALSMLQLAKYAHRDDVRHYLSGTVGDLTLKGPVTNDSFYNLPHLTCQQAKETGLHTRVHGNVVDLAALDTLHLMRQKKSYGVAFPTTREIREFVHRHRAVIVFIDMDSGMDRSDLFGKEQAKLPECSWTRSDFSQSGKEDMNAVSLFKEADHAMLLVGWSCERGAWLVQNSWGAEWGVGGKLWIEDRNVCNDDYVVSAHSSGAGPACMFGSTMSVFVERTAEHY